MSDYSFDHPQEEELHAYLDGELAAGRVGALLEHLEECDGCRRALAELQAFFAQIDSVADVSLEVDYAPRIAARIEARRRSDRAWRWALAAQVAAAVILAYLALPALLPALAQWRDAVGMWAGGLDLQTELNSAGMIVRNLLTGLPRAIFAVFDVSLPARIAPFPLQWWWLLLLPGGLIWLMLNRWLLGRAGGSIDAARENGQA